ncbi:MAG: Ku protein [Armatimonadia bacterium]|nr:Ku protein [Armatimonadia bacterium]
MPRAIWTGAITFGLVHVPVRLVTAVQDTSPDFHMIDPETGSRIHYKTVNDSGDEVERSDLVKGYEVESGEFLVVEPEELDELAPEKTDAIEIDDFVDIADIDPIYYDKPYYLMPDDSAKKPYKLLLAAMEEAGKVGIAKFVMHQREHLTAVRPLHGMLCLVLMRFAEEIRPTEELGLDLDEVDVDDDELDVAIQLIDAMTEKFHPEDFTNQYEQQVRELLNAKAEGEEFVIPERAEEEVETGSLVDALKKSLEKARK